MHGLCISADIYKPGVLAALLKQPGFFNEFNFNEDTWHESASKEMGGLIFNNHSQLEERTCYRIDFF